MESDWLTAEETNTLSSILNAGKKEFLAKDFVLHLYAVL